MKRGKYNKLPKGLLFSVAGARGIVGESIDADVVAELTRAFCSILDPGEIVIGRDTRPSGAELQRAAMESIIETGRDCIDVGIATTPTVEMSVEHCGAAGGIIVTASHNPVQWNALKFLDHRGIFITKEMSERLYRALDSDSTPEQSRNASIRSCDTASLDHIDAVLSLDSIDAGAIRERRFTVGLDCINGAGSVIAPRLLEKLGARVVPLNCKDDGDFYRDPEPRPDNLGELAELVKRKSCDLGFALDPDGDRLALVDPVRGAISEEYTLALAVDFTLSHTPGTVVVNMSTSTIIDSIAERYEVALLRTPVGEAHVVERMLRQGAVVGGEGNGGVILPALHLGRDGILAMALILQFLAEKRSSLRELLDRYSPFVMRKEKTPLEGKFDAERLSDLIREQNPVTIDTTDGVRVGFEDGWYHLRVSNTEGIVRVIAEAADDGRTSDLIRSARAALKASWQ
jgi:phosphomannomutase